MQAPFLGNQELYRNAKAVMELLNERRRIKNLEPAAVQEMQNRAERIAGRSFYVTDLAGFPRVTLLDYITQKYYSRLFIDRVRTVGRTRKGPQYLCQNGLSQIH